MTHESMAILHLGLPREGPGDDNCTREALRRLAPLPPDPIVLDLGCGPGRHTLVLARMLCAHVIAIDLHQPYLDQLNRDATTLGLSHLIETRRMDIGALDVSAGSIDLIWSEGAAYILGFEESLRRWRRLLASNGVMAVSECTWLTDNPPEEAKTFWSEGYPGMRTVDENRRRAETVGLEVFDSFVLPASAWWNDYYSPLIERMARLRPTADANLTALIDETEREIDLFLRHGGSYGYVFYLLRPKLSRG
jgi:cyclopropane fatty-acyl-phospholipid synthase-like methyltransferase